MLFTWLPSNHLSVHCEGGWCNVKIGRYNTLTSTSLKIKLVLKRNFASLLQQTAVSNRTHQDKFDLLCLCSAAPHCCAHTKPLRAWLAARSVSDSLGCSAGSLSRCSQSLSAGTAASAWTETSPLWPVLCPAHELDERSEKSACLW